MSDATILDKEVVVIITPAYTMSSYEGLKTSPHRDSTRDESLP